MPPKGPVAEIGARLGARVLDLVLVAVIIAIVSAGVSLPDRPVAGFLVGALVFWGYETTTMAVLGATIGKRAVGLRVIALDSAQRLPAAAAARRAAMSTALAAIPVLGWAIWAVSAFGDPLGRGPMDRAASTMVVPTGVSLPVATRDLPGYVDGARPPRLTSLGRVGDADVRVRARLRRLADAPLLVAAAGGLALLAGILHSSRPLLLAYLAVWIVLFIADETLRIHRHGATIGHHLAGLVVVDRRTGQAPSTGRSLARATTLALLIYVPVLWPLLVVSLLMMRWSDIGQGLPDLAGNTVVVADPGLAPEDQRQQAMRLRLGRAG